MKYVSLILACLILLGAFVGCSGKPNETLPTTPKPTTPKPEEPEEEIIEMYYDDRTPIDKLTGKQVDVVEIKDEIVTSRIVNSDKDDMSVIRYDRKTKRVVAMGTGTATIVADGEEYKVRVSPAPITLAVITGNSIGAGSKGNGAESVLCEGGTAYNTSLMIQTSTWTSKLKGSALGYGSSDRVPNIDCITEDAGSSKGARGANSALAYGWHNLTGEKMWVINCAVGGSCINQWQPDSKEMYLKYTLQAMNFAAEILKNEVTAGHYEYKGTVVINFGNGNFTYQNVPYDDDELLNKWHDGMWQGTLDGCKVDIDGDGEIDVPFAMGYLPLSYSLSFDACQCHYRTISKDYPHIFYVSDLRRLCTSDEGVRKNFPEIDYPTQNGETLKKPTNVSEFLAADKTHLTQTGYNAQGFEIAQSLYYYVTKNYEVKGITLYDVTDGNKVVDDTMTLKVGEKNKFVAISDPVAASEYEIIVTGALKVDNNFHVTGTAKGEGELIIKYGDRIIKTVKITVE